MDSATWQHLWQDLMALGTAPMGNTAPYWIDKLLRASLVYLVLVLALRWFGKRILAQLNPFDLVVLLVLANTVQNAIIGNDTSLAGGLVGAGALFGMNALLVRWHYQGPSAERLSMADRDIPLIEGGRLCEAQLKRLRITAAELTAKAHERGFDSLEEIDAALLYPNGTIYFRGRHPGPEEQRHRAVLERLDEIRSELARLRG